MNEPIKISRIAIGKKGERIVASILPNCDWANEVAEARHSYDLMWEGIPIDVKTCSVLNRMNKGYRFTNVFDNRLADVKNRIFVLVGLDIDRNYFWVRPTYGMHAYGYYAGIKDAISEKELPDKIREVYRDQLISKAKDRQKQS